MQVSRAMLDLLTLFLFVCTAQARLVNRTMDDIYGDPTTGISPTCSSRITSVNITQDPCTGITCFIKPNTSLAFDGTWSTLTCDSSQLPCPAVITFEFPG